MKNNVIEVSDLFVSYGAIAALQGVSMSVEEGAIIAIIGANGAGKTTLLNAMTGVVPSKSGTVKLRGEDITNLPSHQIARKGVTHVPEGRRIFAQLSVVENLLAGAYNLQKDQEKINRLMEMNFELFPILAERRKQPGGTLSGGEQQMLAIARGLMSEPDVILLDEPSLGIAPIVVETIFEFIVKINQEMRKTVLLVEQNANLALEVASFAYVMETGKIVQENDARVLLCDDAIQRIYLGF